MDEDTRDFAQGPMVMDKELGPICQEIIELHYRVMLSEEWLMKNTQAVEWFEEMSKYDNLLFRLDQKKQKLASIKSGVKTAPATIELPTRPNRNRGF